MKLTADRFYISGISDDTTKLYKNYGFGIEHTIFAYAKMLDEELEEAINQINKINDDCTNLIFHAPFNELTMAPIDEKIGEISMYRYNQFYNESKKFKAKKLVYHTGYLPNVYYMEWFVPQSTKFLIEFLKNKNLDNNIEILIENVFSIEPKYIYEILTNVNAQSHKKLGMCLDIGHVNAYAHSTTVYDWVDMCKDFITHVHIHNNDTVKDYHRDVYDGTLEIKKIIDYILTVIPNATFTVEVREIKDFPKFIKDNYL